MSNDENDKKPRLTAADLTVFTSAAMVPIARQNTYPYCFSVKSISDPDTFKNDSPYMARSFFEEWRHEESLLIREEAMITHLRNEGVLNYQIRRMPKTVDFLFETQKECNIAAMAFLREGKYILDLSHKDKNVPLGQIRKLVHKLREEYSKTNQNVVFKLDPANKNIQAILPSRRAYVDFIDNQYTIQLDI
jgi:hypothetical protein